MDLADDTQLTHGFLSRQNLLLLGGRVAKLRARNGWSQRELARRTKMDSSRLSRIENGRCVPRLDELVRLRLVLGMDLDELVFGRAPEAPQGRLERLARALEEIGDRSAIGVVERLIECLIHEPAAGSASLTTPSAPPPGGAGAISSPPPSPATSTPAAFGTGRT